MSDQSKAEEFIEENNLTNAKAYGTYKNLVLDKEVEIVYIGTQTPWHFEWAKKSLRAGKHVLVETPIAVTGPQVRELVELAKEKERFLMEGFWSRFFPAYAEIRRLVEAEDFGKVRFVNGNVGFPMVSVSSPSYLVFSPHQMQNPVVPSFPLSVATSLT